MADLTAWGWVVFVVSGVAAGVFIAVVLDLLGDRNG